MKPTPPPRIPEPVVPASFVHRPAPHQRTFEAIISEPGADASRNAPVACGQRHAISLRTNPICTPASVARRIPNPCDRGSGTTRPDLRIRGKRAVASSDGGAQDEVERVHVALAMDPRGAADDGPGQGFQLSFVRRGILYHSPEFIARRTESEQSGLRGIAGHGHQAGSQMRQSRRGSIR